MGLSFAQQKTFAINAADDALNNGAADLHDDDATATRVYIWGTRICVDEVQKKFNTFICNFRTKEVDDDENAIFVASGELAEIDMDKPYYLEKLRGINLSEIPILNINLGHLREYSESLYKMIVAYPDVCFQFLYIY